jgi:hypothetical protein
MIKRSKKISSAAWMWVPGFLFFILPSALQAGDVTLAWDPNNESNLAGYKLYYDGDSDSEMYRGTGASEGDSPVVIYLEDLSDIRSPEFTLTGLKEGEDYYFALTAFDTGGLESDFSEEVGTRIEADVTYNKAASSASDTSSETSGGSGGSCFISGAMNGRAGNLPSAGAMVALLLATAAAACAGPALKGVKIIRQRHKKLH